jgi:LSM domain
MSLAERYYACQRHLNRNVRVHMRDGRVYEGTLVNVDRENLYLRENGRDCCRISGFYGGGWGWGAGAAVTTLALFDLLAIALIV